MSSNIEGGNAVAREPVEAPTSGKVIPLLLSDGRELRVQLRPGDPENWGRIPGKVYSISDSRLEPGAQVVVRWLVGKSGDLIVL